MSSKIIRKQRYWRLEGSYYSKMVYMIILFLILSQVSARDDSVHLFLVLLSLRLWSSFFTLLWRYVALLVCSFRPAVCYEILGSYKNSIALPSHVIHVFTWSGYHIRVTVKLVAKWAQFAKSATNSILCSVCCSDSELESLVWLKTMCWRQIIKMF